MVGITNTPLHKTSIGPELASLGPTKKNTSTESAIATLFSSDNFPAKVVGETKSWIDLTHDVSSPLRQGFAKTTNTLKETKDSFTNVFLVSDILSLIDSTFEIPSSISSKVEEKKGALSSASQFIGIFAHRIFAEIIAPFFKDLGFVLADLSKLKVLNIPPIVTTFVNLLSPFVFISSIASAYKSVEGLMANPTKASSQAKVVEKVADLIVHLATFIFAREAALGLFLALSTTKLTAKVAGSFFKNQEETVVYTDPQLMLRHPSLG